MPAKASDTTAKPSLPEPVPDPLIGEVEKRLEPFVPANKREQAAQVMVSIFQESFAGPIAHPKHLAEYEAISPGAANRIITMAEKAQDHNIATETLVVNASIADEKRGLYIGAGILVLLAIGAFVLGMYGNNIAVGILLAAATLDVIALLIQRKKGG